jgi:hypothetical protein
MPLRAVGVTASLTVLCWGVWDWASSDGHATIGTIAGVILVPSAVALAGFLALTLAGLVRIAAEHAASRRALARSVASDREAAPPPGSAREASKRAAA